MKKVLSFVMALAMTATLLCTSAFAEKVDVPVGGVSSKTEVQINQVGGTLVHKYSVDIDFQTMQFTYHKTGDTVWNPDTHQYDRAEGGAGVGWSEDKNVTIRNHSDLPIKFNVTSGNQDNQYGELTVAIADGSGQIELCPVGGPAPEKTATVGIEGIPNSTLGETMVYLSELLVKITRA